MYRKKNYSLFQFSILAWMLFIGISAQAAVITVTTNNNNGAGSLRQAVANAAAGDEIVFDAATNGAPINLTGGQILINKNLTITGNGENQTSIDANANNRVFRIINGATVVIEEMTLFNGSQGRGGAVIIENASNLTLNAVTIEDSEATGGQGGGGIFVLESTLTINDSNIRNNTASGLGGGGIYVNTGSTVTINDSAVNSNDADGPDSSGGGIYNNATLIMNNSSANNNNANRAGGGIEVRNGSMTTLTNTNVNGNNAGVAPFVGSPGNGGGLHVTGNATVNITGGTNNGNEAAAEGGGLWNGAGTMTLDGTRVNNNTASGAAADEGGGGLFNDGGTVIIQNDTRINNNVANGASGSGGGILNVAMGTITMTDSRANNNIANRAGGGIETIAGTTVTITNSALNGNNAGVAPAVAAPGNGGGLHVTDDGNVTMTGTTTNNNVAASEGGGLWNGSGTMILDGAAINANTASGAAADNGGGGIFNNGGTVTISNGTNLFNNVADGAAGSGGGIFNNGGTVTFADGQISGNSSVRAGGGIEATAGSTTNLTNVNLNNNSTGGAPGNGGGLHITGAGDATILGGTVNGNTASSEGGGLWNGTGAMTIDGTIINNNTASGAAADNGGGGIFNAGGNVTINNQTTITDNVADGAAGSGGGILNDAGGSIGVFNSIIESNTAVRAGGGIEATAGTNNILTAVDLINNTVGTAPGNGGGMHVTGDAFTAIDISTVDGNSAANEGGGLWAAGAGTFNVNNSTISNNNAPDGGGLFLQAGSGTLNVINSTVSSNSATNGGGVQVEGGTMNLTSTTIGANTASAVGGGVNVVAGFPNVTNTIIGLNSAPTSPDFNGAFNTVSNTLVQDGSGATGIMNGTNGNKVGLDPELGPLADNGGATLTHLPSSSSPVINMGAANGIPTDQRGEMRVAGGTQDIGSVELQAGQLTNDMCAGAISLGCGDMVLGTTTLATTDGDDNDDDDDADGTNGAAVFYTFVGTGERITISTDFDFTDFDTEIDVFTGDCGNLTFVGGDTDSGFDESSTFSFDSQAGVTYIVRVSGDEGAVGNFQIGLDARLVILCRPPVNTTTEEGFCGANIDLIPPVVLQGNCVVGQVLLDGTPNSTRFFGLGTTTVTWTITSTDPDVPDATCEQEVTITDIEAPEILCPSSVNLYTSWDNCGYPASILSAPTATDNCTTATITADSDNPTFFTPGQYMVNYTATDLAGNSSTCMQWVKVFDTTQPMLTSCPDDIVTTATSADGANVTWTAPTAVDNCPGNIISSSNFNSGDEFPLGTTEVVVELFDPFGNSVDCEFTVTVEPISLNFTIAGLVATENDEPLADVTIGINGSNEVSGFYQTLNDGLYGFGVPMGGDYTITPVKNNDLLNGVSTLDLVKISQHIIGMDLLDSPYQLLAADVNNSGHISTLDAVHLQKAILFVSDEFPNNSSWRFVPNDFVFNNPGNPFAQDIPEVININNLPAAMNDADFVAIKVGDVNGNAATNGLLGTDDRYEEVLQLEVETTEDANRDLQTVAFKTTEFNQLGFQFTLNFDKEKMDFVAMNSDLLTDANFGFSLLEEGAITVSWSKAAAIELTENTVLFSLDFKTKSPQQLTDFISINSRFVKAEAYHQNGDLQDVKLNLATTTADFQVYQNTPNPFVERTLIGFEMPKAGEVVLQITDASGKLIYTVQQDVAEGYQQFVVDAADLGESGVYYYMIKTEEKLLTRKMVLME